MGDRRAGGADLSGRARRWGVVLAAFTLMGMGFGAAYSFAAFFAAFQSEFGAARGHIALVFSLSALLWFSFGVPGGMLADRFGPRGVCLAGVLILAAGLALSALAPSLAALYATLGIGAGVGIGLTYVPSVAAARTRVGSRSRPWKIHSGGLCQCATAHGVCLLRRPKTSLDFASLRPSK